MQADGIFYNTATKRIYACVLWKIYRCRREIDFEWSREMDICRCVVVDVKMQMEIDFLRTPTILIVSNFSLRAARQRGLMSTKRKPCRTKCPIVKHWGSNCNVGFVLGQPFPTKCVSTIKSCGETVILHMFCWTLCAIRVSAAGNHSVVCLCENAHS